MEGVCGVYLRGLRGLHTVGLLSIGSDPSVQGYGGRVACSMFISTLLPIMGLGGPPGVIHVT